MKKLTNIYDHILHSLNYIINLNYYQLEQKLIYVYV